MSEMVERVARAIAAVHIAEVKGTSSEAVVAARVESRWESYQAEATAAIEAMREPTEEMLDEGIDWLEQEFETVAAPDFLGAHVLAEEFWQVMLDPALEPTEATRKARDARRVVKQTAQSEFCDTFFAGCDNPSVVGDLVALTVAKQTEAERIEYERLKAKFG